MSEKGNKYREQNYKIGETKQYEKLERFEEKTK